MIAQPRHLLLRKLRRKIKVKNNEPRRNTSYRIRATTDNPMHFPFNITALLGNSLITHTTIHTHFL